MKRRIFENVVAEYYGCNEAVENMGGSLDDRTDGYRHYIFADALSEDTGRIAYLRKRGFQFHDRTVLTVIGLWRLPAETGRYVRYEISEHDGISDEIEELAVRSYPRDRRFHFDIAYDDERANAVIRGYLRELSEDCIRVYHCNHNGRIVGYTVLKEFQDGVFENVLGAVDADYQNRGAAMGLYAGMLLSMKEHGYKEYQGWISTKNTASLNLHIALGGRFIKARDRYVLWREE